MVAIITRAHGLSFLSPPDTRQGALEERPTSVMLKILQAAASVPSWDCPTTIADTLRHPMVDKSDVISSVPRF